jgi:Tol biopolymer transport system component/DNA-binding winged helix-turn-helix (wHTH) protein
VGKVGRPSHSFPRNRAYNALTFQSDWLPMDTWAPEPARLRFGVFELELQTGELRRSGVLLHMAPQPFKVLALLASRHGQLVTREEIRNEIWGRETFVDFEHGLNVAIKEIRVTLGDNAAAPRYVETLPRRGYRFLARVDVIAGRASALAEAASRSGFRFMPNAEADSAPVEAELELNGSPALRFPAATAVAHVEMPIAYVMASSPAPVVESASRRSAHRWRPFVIAGTIVAAVAAAGLLRYASQPYPPPHITATERITNDSRYIAKMVMGTDGSKIYLEIGSTGWYGFGQVPVTGGEITPFTMKGLLGLFPVSPDGTSILLYGDQDAKDQLYDILIASTSGGPTRLLTRGLNVAWSVDSKQVIFTNTKRKIYTLPISGGQPHLLRSLEGKDDPYGFAYSPDGTRIRFNLGGRRMAEMSSDGSNLHEILTNWHSNDQKCCGIWAPDGSFYVFISAATSEVAGHPAFQIWAMDERRSWLRKSAPEPIQLTNGPMTWFIPAIFTRDGRKILGDGQIWRGELVRYNATTKQLEPFLAGISADMLDFSRDGRSVVYAPFPGNVLYRANADGTDVQQVISIGSHPVVPRLSPDTSQIAYVEDSFDEPNSIYTVSSHGGTPVRVFPENKCCNESDPTWSPDGTRLALWMESPEGKTESELKIVTLSTHEISYLPPPPKRTWSPRWSPDGRYIVCLTKPYPDTDGMEIYDFNTNSWRVLLTGTAANWPSWSHDSRWIYYLSGPKSRGNRVEMFRISPHGGTPEPILDLQDFRGTGYDFGWYGLDVNDNPLLLRDAGTNEVYALTLAGN